jgi:hypothetical protein
MPIGALDLSRSAIRLHNELLSNSRCLRFSGIDASSLFAVRERMDGTRMVTARQKFSIERRPCEKVRHHHPRWLAGP